MKYYLWVNSKVPPFNHLWMLSLCVASLFLFTSCDKVSGLADRLKDIGGADAYSAVDQMNHKQAMEVIAEESKLVMIEFFRDT